MEKEDKKAIKEKALVLAKVVERGVCFTISSGIELITRTRHSTISTARNNTRTAHNNNKKTIKICGFHETTSDTNSSCLLLQRRTTKMKKILSFILITLTLCSCYKRLERIEKDICYLGQDLCRTNQLLTLIHNQYEGERHGILPYPVENSNYMLPVTPVPKPI